MDILTLNAGSNSLKFSVISVHSFAAAGEETVFGETRISGAYDNIAKENSSFSLLDGKQVRHKESEEVRDHGQAAELLLNWLEEGNAAGAGISNLGDIDRIGHRVVHGGDFFEGPVPIDDDVVSRIEQLEDIAPLHNASALKVIRAMQAGISSKIPGYAVFDTVFHRTIPDEAALYPLPPDLARRHKIRRYGFHGISHRYMAIRYAQITGRRLSELRLITLHLEGGSSAAAICNGRSVDTSMGFTPLEGLMMGTRSGDIDPAIVTYLMRKEKMDASEVEEFLNKKCGLAGVSGFSADTRELRDRISDPAAALALDMFSYRVRKYIGAYLAVLGGADAIIFGGGIGENTQIVREKICKGLEWCGASLDLEKNAATVDREDVISMPGAAISIWVIPTREDLMIARDVAAL
ncbi:MAG TPA: acetate kinase [Bryobacteraceae bacterium]|nr:acetate kinase [Bryobacteraceae bacterium]